MEALRSNAWVVVVPTSALIDSAILSGKFLRQLGTDHCVVALVSRTVTGEDMWRLEALNCTFDLVLSPDTGSLMKQAGIANAQEEELLLLSAMTLGVFSKTIVVRAGVLASGDLEKLFDEDSSKSNRNRVLMTDIAYTDWKVAMILPQPANISQMRRKKYETGHVMDLLFDKDGKEGEICEQGNLEDIRKWNAKRTVCVDDPAAVELLAQLGGPDKMEAPLKMKEDTSDWVAIVGISCRFPQADSPEEYWEILENGRNTSSSPPSHRTSLVDMDPRVKANFLKCPIDQFDAGFFGISPNEAGITDPQARLMLEVSWEAFEEAGINPANLYGTNCGVFYGSWLQEYRDALTEANPGTRGADLIRRYIGNGFGCSSAKLSYFYGFNGPNIATESGCSSSMIAVDMAVKSLQRNECPLALACGANLILHMSAQQKVWAVDGTSKTFDAGADGYGRAEGIAVLILKRYRDAVRDGDQIHGIIRGSATSQEGLSKSFGSPTVESEYSSMRDALKMAKVDPSQVDYVEAHATGTAVGDPIEAAAILKAYSSMDKREEPLWIGSGKTNVGHSESCSGLAGITKVILSMKHELIPPHINVSTVNPLVDFSAIPGKIALDHVPWKRDPQRPRIAGVSSFGISGTDVHLILQEGPEQILSSQNRSESLEKCHLLTISAKSEIALKRYTDLFRAYLEYTSDSIQDITYTANVLRPHHQFRRTVLGGSKEEIIANVQNGDFIHSNGTVPLGGEKICFTFPGKIGATDIAPFRILYKTAPYFKKTMDKCDAIFKTTTGSITSLLGPILSEDVVQTDRDVEWYILHTTCQYCLAKLWIHHGVRPQVVLGHCFGEMSALLISGALEPGEFYKLADVLPHFFQCQKQIPAAIMAIQSDRTSVDKLIHQFQENNKQEMNDAQSTWIDVTSVNSHDQTVVAASPNTIQTFRDFLKERQLRCTILSMEICAHSRAVEPAYTKAMEGLNKMRFQTPSIPCVSSATGKLIGDGELDAMFMYKIFRNCVNFTDACATVQEIFPSDIFLEMSGNRALTKFTQDNIASSTCVPSFRQPHDHIHNSVAELYTLGVNMDWCKFYDKAQERVKLPHYPFQRKSYWFERNLQTKSTKVSRMAAIAGKVVHPVLGTVQESPACLTNLVIFQHDLFDEILTEKETTFVGDHVIGTRVILPGACFLEMILSAWKLGANGEAAESGISVKSFKIHAPLLVEENSGTCVQAVVNKESNSVSVYAKNEGFPWRLHASAQIESCGSIDWECKKISDYQLDNLSKTPVDQLYLSALEIGLHFGPDFKSIQGIYSNAESGEFLAQVVIPSHGGEQVDAFLCHPILIDAMIQCFLAYKFTVLKQLHVPVQVGKFSLLPKAFTAGVCAAKWYVHCQRGSSRISLLSKDGACVAVMEGLELVATSADAVLGSAENGAWKQRKGQSPLNLYNVTWQRSRLYQNECCHEFSGTDSNKGTGDLAEVQGALRKFDKFSDAEAELDANINRLCYLYVVKAIFKLGWTPGLSIDDMVNGNQLDIIPELLPAFKHYLSYLGDNPVEYETRTKVDEAIDEILKLSCVKQYAAMTTISECGQNLAEILKGSVSAHKILFDRRNLADNYYKTSRLLTFMPHLETVFKTILPLHNNSTNKDHVLRILEVGAGTGAFPRNMVPILKSMGIKYEYHFTDISPTLVKNAPELFGEEDRSNFVFKTLDLERDPLSQGYIPGYYDLVVALDVLHATRNLNKTLNHISMVTRMGGRLLLGETEKPVREADICFGILEGYWLFDDGIRTGHCTVDSPTWLRLLADHGFGGDPLSLLFCDGQMSVLSAQKTSHELLMTSDDSRKDWIVFVYGDNDVEGLKVAMESIALRRVRIVRIGFGVVGADMDRLIRVNMEISNGSLEGILFWMTSDDHLESRQIVEPLLLTSQYLLERKMKVKPRFVVATEGCWQISEKDELTETGVFSATAWGFMRTVRMELQGILSKCVDLEPGREVGKMVEDLMLELWLDDKESEVVYRDGVRYVRRLTQIVNDGPKEIEIPNGGEFQVELPVSKVINDVRFIPAGNEDASSLAGMQIKVEVRCVSLNFKDVLAVMKPSREFEGIRSIGLDFSGEVTEVGENVTRWKVGDEVFGCAWNMDSMRSHLRIDQDVVMALPDTLSFEEAATLPAVFVTAWHCMVNVAKLRAGQTLLIHAASGGVGLIAIQIAKMLGVKVIGTAGSNKKRRCLRSQGVEHVFNSRTLDFEQEVKMVTGGQGVDMVLNCLTGPGFKEASLAVCRDGGHFVEISKLDIWTVEEVTEMRPLVNYDIVDVSELDKDVLIGIIDKLSELLEAGSITTLPHTTFPASRLAEALAYLQKAKQIGKVIIKMPQTSANGSQRDLLFNDRSTYLITGGKGAIGFAVCKWMLSQGAKYIVLAGRSEASDKVKQEALRLGDGFGAVVIFKKLDISNYDQVQKLISGISDVDHLPPLRGIHHCAGILSDRMIAHQDWANFAELYKTKLEGAWNLHRSTLSIPLDHFILYSSASATFGIVGQSNYVAGSTFMDHLAQFRHSYNLPALSINWGHWKAGLAENVQLRTLIPFSIEHGIRALEGIMRDYKHQSNIIAGLFSFDAFLKMAPHYKNTFFETLSVETGSTQMSSSTRAQNRPTSDNEQISLAEEFKNVEGLQERTSLVRKFVVRILCETLGADEQDIREDVKFSDMGMDSLMSIEFTNKIYSGMECRGVASGANGGSYQEFIDLEESGTLSQLTKLIVATLESPAICPRNK